MVQEAVDECVQGDTVEEQLESQADIKEQALEQIKETDGLEVAEVEES